VKITCAGKASNTTKIKPFRAQNAVMRLHRPRILACRVSFGILRSFIENLCHDVAARSHKFGRQGQTYYDGDDDDDKETAGYGDYEENDSEEEDDDDDDDDDDDEEYEGTSEEESGNEEKQ
jgi:hypothetical protein